MAATSPLQHLTALMQQLQRGEMSTEAALERLGYMRTMLANMQQAVSMLHVPQADTGAARELKEASLAGIAGYGQALDLMEEFINSGVQEAGERSLSAAQEAEALIKSLQRQAEDVIENYINP
ncbi:MAG: hypothetical protein ACYCW6_10445 [Candidatus Xenobia bacterium]